MTDLDHRPATPPPLPSRAAEEGRRPPLSLGLLAILGLFVLAGLAGGWPLLAMIGALVVMISLHELGHYLTAKWAGMKVTEFFIGFGPRIWSTTRGETEYGIKVIPAGAYVKIVGMHNLDEYDPADVDRTYLSKPFWRRLSVAVAGSTMHFLLALLVFFVAHAFVGLDGGRAILTQGDEDAVIAGATFTVDDVSVGSGAAAAGLEPGDRIVSVAGEPITDWGSFKDAVQGRPDETVPVVLERAGEVRTVDVHIGAADDDPQRGFFGVAPDLRVEQETVGFADAIGRTGDAFGTTVGQTFAGLGHILSPSGLADLGRAAFTNDDEPVVRGPSDSGQQADDDGGGTTAVGLIGITDGGAGLIEAGEWGHWLTLFAVINIFIGVFNLLPVLPLDGGHVAIAVYEKVRSMLRGGEPYHVDVVKLLPFTYGVVLLLGFLMVSLVVLDTRSLVGG